MSDDAADAVGRAAINLALMIADTEADISQRFVKQEATEFDGGFLYGLTLALYVLEGHTADEAWDHLGRLRLVADPLYTGEGDT